MRGHGFASFILAASLESALTVGCGSTEGPLLVRNHATDAGLPETNTGNDAGGAFARPATDISWQVQLSGSFDATVEVSLFYVDLDNLTNAEQTALIGAGRHLACYLSAGSYEPWRTDAAAFPSSVIGNALADYPNERWLDIRSTAVASLMSARLDQLKSKGCNSISVTNVTHSGEDSGFSITATDESAYLEWLSEQIQGRGLFAGLATADDRLSDMEPHFDWAYAQDCWLADRCSGYAPFVAAKKAVLAVVFGEASNAPTLCSGVTGSGINLLVKPMDLGASRTPCLP